MLYASYKRKIEKVAEVLKTIWKYRLIVLSVIAVAMVSTAGFLVSKGTVIDQVACPISIAYGDTLGYKANGLFSNISYQYSSSPSFEEFSTTMPRMPGTYYVRAVSSGSFNTNKYGKVYAFDIVKKKVDVSIVETTWTYGDTPSVTASLAYNDTISCSEFDYSNLGEAQATVSALEDSITITSYLGEDVTEAYDLTPVEKNVSLQKRNITITVGNAEKTYDALPLQFNACEIT